ncbi:MAG: diacylglycerol kinase family lipid kinase [Anaerolineae bacterium]|jgi:YegS/Rv2252/BmrU family lipid kinase|nr:diacylglycerol kinase family lipid kinase [Anaerolineae bacterium]
MPAALVIINPHAAAGAAVQVWHSIEADFQRRFGVPEVVITQSAAEIPGHIAAAAAAGIRQVISVGGDGTNHALINALVHHNQAQPDRMLTYAALPAGTGQDWARGMGMPLHARAALDWLARAKPRTIDLGHVAYDDQARYFLNISSAGISHDVVQRVEKADKRRPWTFFNAAVAAILRYQPEAVTVRLDGEPWYAGRMYIIAIANGSYFGQGMYAAPMARIDDGWLDVLVMAAVSRPRLLATLPTLYNGTHLQNPAVRVARARRIEIDCAAGRLGMDLDGEPAAGQRLVYTVQPARLHILG